MFGIIKSAMGFRQFLLRGVNKASLKWDLVCLAYNVRRLHTLGAGLKLAAARYKAGRKPLLGHFRARTRGPAPSDRLDLLSMFQEALVVPERMAAVDTSPSRLNPNSEAGVDGIA